MMTMKRRRRRKRRYRCNGMSRKRKKKRRRRILRLLESQGNQGNQENQGNQGIQENQGGHLGRFVELYHLWFNKNLRITIKWYQTFSDYSTALSAVTRHHNSNTNNFLYSDSTRVSCWHTVRVFLNDEVSVNDKSFLSIK